MASGPTPKTPIGGFRFPHTRVADTKFKDYGELKVTLRLSGQDAVDFRQMIEDASDREMVFAEKKAAQKLADAPPAQRAALKDKVKATKGDLPYKAVYNDQGELTGEIDFNFKKRAKGMTKARNGRPSTPYTGKIAHFDASGQPTSVDLPMFGAQGRVSYLLVTSTNATFTAFVSLKPIAVQITRLGGDGDEDRSAEDYGFEAVEGGFVDDGTNTPAAADEAPFNTTEGDAAEGLDPLL